jgi:probable F420-dependent oxidoreductase
MASRPFRFGIVTAFARSGADWREKAQRVEQLGFATLLMPDRLGLSLSTIPALAVAATATTTLHVGSFVIANGLRNPALLARESATLSFLSDGRFEFGIGAGVGDEDYRVAGVPFESPGRRVEQLAETLATFKSYFAAATSDADVARAGFPPSLPKTRPPILVAATGPRLLTLAAREADIVAIGVRPPTTEAEIAEKVDFLRQAAGDRFDQIELSLNLVAVAGNTPLSPSALARIRGFFKTDLEQLIQSKSPFVLSGSVDQMCDQLLAYRERLGTSYITVAEDMMDALAPVVARLAGR